MKKVVSYRQKIIELARIYKIAKVLDVNQKLTTYEIELELLRNRVPIPSRRGYLSHKIINEFLKPIYNNLKDKFEINININLHLLHNFHYWRDHTCHHQLYDPQPPGQTPRPLVLNCS